MKKDQYCNHDCNQGRDCPVRAGTHKPAEAAHQIQEPEADIWPCVNIDVDERGNVTNAKLYSPGLPAGNHDVYPVRVPYIDEHSEAWLACAAELEKASPGFMTLGNMNGIECAVAAIRDLAARAASAPAAQAAPAAQSVANADGRFTKKPVTIDAIKWTGSNLREVIAFTDGPPDTRSIHAGMAWEAYVDLVARDGLKIYTLEGKMLANIGDWIIRGIKGEYYPCKPDIFEATYTSAPQAQADARDALTPAARDVLAERARQVSAEGWTPERDDQYTDCQLAAAAASYAVCGKDPKALKLMGVTAWPWRDYWWKPETYRRNLEKAGALILAEIERIDRQPSRA